MELGTRAFSEADQQAFAALSNDHNPMHMDSRAARRTQMGAPVVHGINGVLWLLELTCGETLRPISGLKANFSSPIYLGEQVQAFIVKKSDQQLRLQVRVGDALATAVSIDVGNPGDSSTHIAASPPMDRSWPTAPIPRRFDELANLSGSFAVAGAEDAPALYPKLSARVGATRVAALAALSRLVGMICPGLHSIFSGLVVRFTRDNGDAMRFSVVETDSRFNIVRMLVAGAGIEGEITAISRPAPTTQPSARDICGLVSADAYRGARVLVVGGSRGLGEVTAKTCAAGGAEVVITYASGKEEARAVVQDINDAGGTCSAIRLDVRSPDFAGQLADLRGPITHLYYYATGPIAQRRTQFLSQPVLDNFLQFYAIGFAAICQALLASGSSSLVAFYPSSVAVDETPKGWVEYAMAKAAGEVLCRELDTKLPGLRVVHQRLPRVLTDQTATARGDQGADVLQLILPIVNRIQQTPLQPQRAVPV